MHSGLDLHGSAVRERDRELATLVVDLFGLRNGTDGFSRVLAVLLHIYLSFSGLKYTVFEPK